jgi:hypothetical protein
LEAIAQVLFIINVLNTLVPQLALLSARTRFHKLANWTLTCATLVIVTFRHFAVTVTVIIVTIIAIVVSTIINSITITITITMTKNANSVVIKKGIAANVSINNDLTGEW